MFWTGQKKLAFIPLYLPNALPHPDVVPADVAGEIRRRVFSDPDPKTGANRSLRAYIRAVSYGIADLDAVVMPMETREERSVAPDVLEATMGAGLRAAGYHSAAIVRFNEAGDRDHAGFWVRFALADDLGGWAMDFIHSLTGFADLNSPGGDSLGVYDEMACACGTHPSAYTKAAIGWLSGSSIAHHAEGAPPKAYGLRSVGLPQPPQTDRWTALRIGSQVPYLMVEARQRVDPFDGLLPSDGVLVYQIQTTHPLGFGQNGMAAVRLLASSLAPSQTFTSSAGVTVRVTSQLADGFSVFVGARASVPWTNVSEGRTTPGGRISALQLAPEQILLVLADSAGGVYATSGGAATGWGPWASVSEGSTTPGAPLTAVITGVDRVALFLADPGGGVYTASGSPSTGWGPWASVSEGSTTPGAPITAVITGSDQITLFLADPGGGVYTASGSSTTGGWGPWSSVSEGRSTPGGAISAVVTGPGQVSIFLADSNGGVYTASGGPATGWGPWTSVAEGSTTPGAFVAAVPTGPNQISLFLADPAGGVFSIEGSAAAGWGSWESVAGGATIAGAPIAAVPMGSGQVALFLADAKGEIFATTGSHASGWEPWSSVSEGQSTPGAPIAALVATPGQAASLCIADREGGVYTSTEIFVS